jgi:hypothetical protein
LCARLDDDFAGHLFGVITTTLRAPKALGSGTPFASRGDASGVKPTTGVPVGGIGVTVGTIDVAGAEAGVMDGTSGVATLAEQARRSPLVRHTASRIGLELVSVVTDR